MDSTSNSQHSHPISGSDYGGSTGENSPSAGKGKEVDTGRGREGKVEEIGLLLDLYNLHNKTGRYLFSGSNGQRDFYKFWIEEGDYATKKEPDNKINELHERFLKNKDKNVEAPTDPVDVDILRFSEWIWVEEIDSYDDQEQDPRTGTI